MHRKGAEYGSTLSRISQGRSRGFHRPQQQGAINNAVNATFDQHGRSCRSQIGFTGSRSVPTTDSLVKSASVSRLGCRRATTSRRFVRRLSSLSNAAACLQHHPSLRRHGSSAPRRQHRRRRSVPRSSWWYNVLRTSSARRTRASQTKTIPAIGNRDPQSLFNADKVFTVFAVSSDQSRLLSNSMIIGSSIMASTCRRFCQISPIKTCCALPVLLADHFQANTKKNCHMRNMGRFPRNGKPWQSSCGNSRKLAKPYPSASSPLGLLAWAPVMRP